MTVLLVTVFIPCDDRMIDGDDMMPDDDCYDCDCDRVFRTDEWWLTFPRRPTYTRLPPAPPPPHPHRLPPLRLQADGVCEIR